MNSMVKGASLERRTLVLLALALAALAAALVGGVELRASSAGEVQRRAFESAEATLAALDRALPASTPVRMGEGAARARVYSLIEPLVDASAGQCDGDGTIRDVVTIAPLIESPSAGAFAARTAPRMLPLDRAVVSDECRRARPSVVARRRFAAPNDVLYIVTRGTDAAGARFVLIRMPNRARLRSDTLWLAIVPTLAVVALALVALTFDLLFMLRRGRLAIESSLARIAVDLRAPIERPRAQEMASIADALGTMVGRLNEALDRERALQRSLAHAAQLAALGRMVAGVAHEVRNPLAGIKLRLDRLQRRGLDARSNDDVLAASGEVSRLDSLVRSLLQVSQRSGQAPQPVALAPLVDERAPLAEQLGAARSVRVERVGEGVAIADRAQLVAVLDNLLRNAVEASPEGARVTVAIEPREAEVLVTITDRGAGVASDREHELFEPFFTTKAGGTGLGLFLSKTLVEAQEGTLQFRRIAGETQLIVTLKREVVR